MSPFEAVYGFKPPSLATYVKGVSSNAAVDDTLRTKDEILALLKENLNRAQTRMKQYADLRRTKVEFNVGDLVFLKLRPYRQTSARIRRHMKLSHRSFGPYKVLERIGSVAYKLKLPGHCHILHVYHVSLLKQRLGSRNIHSTDLPVEGILLPEPYKILAYRTKTRCKKLIPQVLIQWAHSSEEDATWEDSSHIQQEFPNFSLANKAAN